MQQLINFKREVLLKYLIVIYLAVDRSHPIGRQ
jgi:hypothetical protein